MTEASALVLKIQLKDLNVLGFFSVAGEAGVVNGV